MWAQVRDEHRPAASGEASREVCPSCAAAAARQPGMTGELAIAIAIAIAPSGRGQVNQILIKKTLAKEILTEQQKYFKIRVPAVQETDSRAR